MKMKTQALAGVATPRFLALLVFFFSKVLAQVGAFGMPKLSGLPHEEIVELARKRYLPAQTRQKSDSNGKPMSGRVAVITGAAGGIGGELSKLIHRLGGTVVALDRDVKGLELLRETLDTGGDATLEGCGRILPIPTYHEDLSSVASAAETIKSEFEKIDLLINNAGLSYPLDSIPGQPNMISAHGKDLAFTVNYLSHFLLTEKLSPKLADGRVVHVTSTYHWKVDGNELLPLADGSGPLAYQSDPTKQSPKHTVRSYANTKLAQIWHSRSIPSSKCSSVCACPTWAATGIAGSEGRDFLQKYAFAVSDCGPGITSAINAILRTDDELKGALNDGTCFVANSRSLQYIKGRETLLSSDFVTNTLGWRDTLSDILGAILLFTQKYTHDEFIIQETSRESRDKEKCDQFYHWSMKEVEEWL